MNNLKKFLCGAAAVAILSSGAVLGAGSDGSAGTTSTSETLFTANVEETVIIKNVGTSTVAIPIPADRSSTTVSHPMCVYTNAASGDVRINLSYKDKAGSAASTDAVMDDGAANTLDVQVRIYPTNPIGGSTPISQSAGSGSAATFEANHTNAGTGDFNCTDANATIKVDIDTAELLTATAGDYGFHVVLEAVPQ